MSKGLPVTWTTCALSSVATITTGNTPSTAVPENFGGPIPFVKPSDLDKRLPIVKTDTSLSLLGAEQSRLLRKGATLVSCIGNLGKVGLAGVELATNQQINAVEFTVGLVDDTYGHYYCRTLKEWMESEASATTISILNKGRFSAAPFVLAPLSEQTRIANQLDTLLTRVQACNDRFDAIPALLKRFRQTVLDAATKGELTAVWREGRGDPIWENTEIGKCGIVSGGLTKNSKREALSLRKPYLRVANVQSNRLDLSDVAEIGLTQPEYEKTKLQKDDLLIVEGNGSIDQVGRVAIWSNELEDCVHQNHLIRLRTVGPLARWVLLWLQSTPGRESLMELASTTTGLYTLSISKVSSVPIQLPSREEQTEIVRRVGALFAIADRIEASTNVARAYAQRLSPLVLAKAFRGELVPQDPQDESASDLLNRITTAQSLEPKKRTAKTATRRMSKIEPRGVNKSLRGNEPLEATMKLDLIPENYLEAFVSDAQGVSAKDLWLKSKLVIDDFYVQLSREINLGLLEIDIQDESIIYRSATSQRGQQ